MLNGCWDPVAESEYENVTVSLDRGCSVVFNHWEESIIGNGCEASNDGGSFSGWLRKYLSEDLACYPVNNVNNERIIRYADVLLMLAEAYVGTGNPAAALPYINQVRERAGISPLASVTLNDIKQERLWELSGEFQEYPDLQRWGDLEQAVLDGPQSSQTGYNSKNELWPIHIDILNGNPNLTQNPGW